MSLYLILPSSLMVFVCMYVSSYIGAKRVFRMNNVHALVSFDETISFTSHESWSMYRVFVRCHTN